MTLPTVECFRQMDIIDQLTALYQAILNISGSEFSPDQISGLSAWYKEDGIVREEASVSSWTDSSGNSNTLTIPVGSPVFEEANLNGFDTVGFLGEFGGTPLSKGSPLFEGTAGTLFMVVRKSSSFPDAGWYTARNDDPNNHPDASDDVFDGFMSTARKACGAQVVPINDNWRILSVRSRNGEYRIDFDGQNQFATNVNTFNVGLDFIIGAGGFDGVDTSFPLQGSIAEVIAYNAFLTDGQVESVLNYLRNRFAL